MHTYTVASFSGTPGEDECRLLQKEINPQGYNVQFFLIVLERFNFMIILEGIMLNCIIQIGLSINYLKSNTVQPFKVSIKTNQHFSKIYIF